MCGNVKFVNILTVNAEARPKWRTAELAEQRRLDGDSRGWGPGVALRPWLVADTAVN